MALKPPKNAVQTETIAEQTNKPLPAIDTAEIENLLADSILDSIDWQAVKALMLEKAKERFWAWIGSASPSTDINLSMQAEAIAIGSSEVES